jgi:hypothetical protein
MGVSVDDSVLLESHDHGRAKRRPSIEEESTMKTTIKCIAPWLAAAAISAAIGLAPIASAAPAATPSSPDTVVNHPNLSTAPTPTPFDTGSDPLVEGNIGADPAIPYFPGEGRAF